MITVNTVNSHSAAGTDGDDILSNGIMYELSKVFKQVCFTFLVIVCSLHCLQASIRAYGDVLGEDNMRAIAVNLSPSKQASAHYQYNSAMKIAAVCSFCLASLSTSFCMFRFSKTPVIKACHQKWSPTRLSKT
jgi:hypothetical protein